MIYDLAKIEERIILVGVQTAEAGSGEESLDELEELVRTAGASVCGRILQVRESIHPGTYIGKGKIQELKFQIFEAEATGIVCDDELSPAQLGNLEKELDCKIMDRTLLILDIFARRATSSEGNIQVELAQLRYRASRLVGLRNSLSRLGGGIGTRGPGEKKLEMDRRLIRTRIGQLKRQLQEVKKHREQIHAQRTKSHIKTAALVGYSNAGKSSWLNAITGTNVLADDMLFATLDTTTRVVELPDGQEIWLTDTVGFIQKLPHHLIEAFRSTLEEVLYADIIIHVVDASNPQMDRQMHVVYETLQSLGVQEKPVITLFNKQDKLASSVCVKDLHADYTILASVKDGQGMMELKQALAEILRGDQIYIERTISYEKAGLIQVIRRNGQLIGEEYLETGIRIKAYVPKELYFQLL